LVVDGLGILPDACVGAVKDAGAKGPSGEELEPIPQRILDEAHDALDVPGSVQPTATRSDSRREARLSRSALDETRSAGWAFVAG
jgi:hypothetical protein